MIRGLARFLPAQLPLALFLLLVLAARFGLLPRIARLFRAHLGLAEAPWAWLAAVTVASALVCALVIFTPTGQRPEGSYEPAHIEGGRVVPGRVVPP